MKQPVPPELQQFAPAKQRRLDQLLEQCADGTISTSDKAKLESLVAEAEEVMVANSRRLAEFAHSQSPQPPVAAVPVTVWVTPQSADT
jgi:hypothetical protein